MTAFSTLVFGICSQTASGQFTAIRLSETPSAAHAVRNGTIGGVFTEGAIQPAIWSAPGASPVGLGFNPEWAGRVSTMTDTHQFGFWGNHAAMWSGTAQSYVNLNPAGSEYSEVLAANSTQQGGWTDFLGEERKATLWSGSAASAVYLQPAGAFTSSIQAMTEARQGGYVGFSLGPGQGSVGHAALWSGTAASFVDMNPDGYSGSSILGMFGNQQVGVAAVDTPGAPARAGMWFGTPGSFVNMHPFPTGLSQINATCGTAQVGYMNSVGLGGAGVRAVIWFGTPESVMDLSQFLLPGYGQSIATCVEERDGVFTVGGYVRYGITDQAFVWVGVPAPGTGAIVLAWGLVMGRRARRGGAIVGHDCTPCSQAG